MAVLLVPVLVPTAAAVASLRASNGDPHAYGTTVGVVASAGEVVELSGGRASLPRPPSSVVLVVVALVALAVVSVVLAVGPLWLMGTTLPYRSDTVLSGMAFRCAQPWRVTPAVRVRQV